MSDEREDVAETGAGAETGPGANPNDRESGDEQAVRVRGVYATALTRILADAGLTVVQASPPIRDRFDATFPCAPADASVETTDDRLGIGVVGRAAAVRTVVDSAREVGRDALAWRDPTPRGALYAGRVTDTLGSGAVVELGEGAVESEDPDAPLDGDDGASDAADGPLPVAGGDRRGFLPYSKTAAHVEEGDELRVQVTEAAPPWSDGRPVLDTTVRVHGSLLTLVRGGDGSADRAGTGGGPDLADLLPTDPPAGWRPDWAPAADDADLDALEAALDSACDRARALDDAFEGAAPPADFARGCYWPGESTAWVRFGRESRFGLDERRRAVTATMTGHHRIKAGAERASAAVDFVEAVCPDAGAEATDPGDAPRGGEGGTFPFDAVTRQFGPDEGDGVRIEHGKPDGRSVALGSGEVTALDPDGTVVVRREMSGRGTYDGLGVDQRPGDVAVTKLTEGKWWYPTVYRGEDGTKRGTYVNVCTPVEVFPRAVRYVDLHVDVVKRPEGAAERVDDDELDAAVAAGLVPEPLAEKARSVAAAVENAL